LVDDPAVLIVLLSDATEQIKGHVHLMKRLLYRLLRLSNDVNAVRRGRIGRRVARRAYGRVTGRLARRWFG
jgi:hypothetical protein